jgi:thiol:disulfide interchange protein DsbA
MLNRREFQVRVLGGAAAAALGSSVWAQGGPAEGVNFKRLEAAQPVGVDAGKVEVLEFFSYACPSCFQFDSFIEAWKAKQGPEVSFRRIPVPFLMSAELFQRSYFALESMGALAAGHARIFNAVHIERQRLSKPEEVAQVVAKAGVDSDKFQQAYSSFGVAGRVAQAQRLAQAYRIEGVPTLVVQGRWTTSPSMARGNPEALAVLDHLVGLARATLKR